MTHEAKDKRDQAIESVLTAMIRALDRDDSAMSVAAAECYKNLLSFNG